MAIILTRTMMRGRSRPDRPKPQIVIFEGPAQDTDLSTFD